MHNEVSNTVLKIFDFDDTLVHSTANIIVYRENGAVDHISSAEFRDVDLSNNDILDFSEFEIYPPGLEPGPAMADFVDSMKKDPSLVYVVSARENKRPIHAALKDLGVPIKMNHIYAVGSANPQKKYDAVKAIASSINPSGIFVYEDNAKNIDAISRLSKEMSITYSFKHFK